MNTCECNYDKVLYHDISTGTQYKESIFSRGQFSVFMYKLKPIKVYQVLMYFILPVIFPGYEKGVLIPQTSSNVTPLQGFD